MSELHEFGFSGNTSPNLFTTPEFGTEYLAARKAAVPPAKDVYPARDDRYPAYAGPMADGRLVLPCHLQIPFHRPPMWFTPIHSIPKSILPIYQQELV